MAREANTPDLGALLGFAKALLSPGVVEGAAGEITQSILSDGMKGMVDPHVRKGVAELLAAAKDAVLDARAALDRSAVGEAVRSLGRADAYLDSAGRLAAWGGDETQQKYADAKVKLSRAISRIEQRGQRRIAAASRS